MRASEARDPSSSLGKDTRGGDFYPVLKAIFSAGPLEGTNKIFGALIKTIIT